MPWLRCMRRHWQRQRQRWRSNLAFRAGTWKSPNRTDDALLRSPFTTSTGLRIIVAEHDRHWALFLQRMLETCGHDVLIAKAGEEALRLINSAAVR